MNAPIFVMLMAGLATGAAAQNDTPTDNAISPPAASLLPELRPGGFGIVPGDQMPALNQTTDGADERGADSESPEPDAGLDENVAPAAKRIAAAPQALSACHRELRALGATFDLAASIAESDDEDCGITSPIQLSGLPGGVELKPAGLMRCETARALARWTEDHVLPAAEQLSERGVMESVELGGSYVCRRRNGRPEGKLSEHAFGNALDIMAFHFETGEPIKVQPRERDGTLAEAFQDAVRATACLHFTTVLGPGTDASHANHLHLDVKAREGRFRLCQ
ncbi:extensin family protein [uncultured Sulfitobacter sp.]|uniref:extensin-like domain-containing protein n=1 Tax=uncultured Sulfitobacter sp. TaxID=191468 RepID=UPI0030DA1804|tara:strand:+ start:1896 stop:2735 length:840 start_codon:yes stop_codon:yes gene_type:complete